MSISAKSAADALLEALEAAGCTEESMSQELNGGVLEATGGHVVFVAEGMDPMVEDEGEEIVEQEVVEESEEEGDLVRPELTWNQIISEAIEDSPERRVTLLELYALIERNHPYFKGLPVQGNQKNAQMIGKWQRQIKQTLRDSKIFHKLIPVSDPNNGLTSARLVGLPSYWTMDKGTKEKLFSRKPKKNTFISKEAGKTRKTVANGLDSKPLQVAMIVGENIMGEAGEIDLKDDVMHELSPLTAVMYQPDGGEPAPLKKVPKPKPKKPKEWKGTLESLKAESRKVLQGVPRAKGTYAAKERWQYKSEKTFETMQEKSKSNGYQICTDMFGEQLYKCVHCDYTAKSQENVKGHINIEHIKKTFYCNICGRPYQTYKVLKEHLTKVHDQPCYPCTFPNCRFKSADSDVICEHYLQKHNSTEVPTSYRPIAEHLRLNWSEKKAGTRVGTKSKQYAPSVEQLIQTSESLYSCKLCKHESARKEYVAEHIKVKHMGIQRPCLVEGCDFTTGYVHNIKTHVINVHGWKEIECMIPGCGFKTLRDRKMQCHLSQVHKATYDEDTHSLVCRA